MRKVVTSVLIFFDKWLKTADQNKEVLLRNQKKMKNVAQNTKSSGLEYFEEKLDKWSKTADQNKQWQLHQLEKNDKYIVQHRKKADQHTFLLQLLGKTKIVFLTGISEKTADRNTNSYILRFFKETRKKMEKCGAIQKIQRIRIF